VTAGGADADFWETVRVIGHRGAAGLAPENSLDGLRRARAAGVRAVEFDVRLAADGTPVLGHDRRLRLADGSRPPIGRFTRDELARLDAEHGAPAPVPTLAQALAVCRELALAPVVEIKPAPGREAQVAAAVAGALSAPEMRALPALVSSFCRTVLAHLARMLPARPRALNAHPLPRRWREDVAALGLAALHLNVRWLDGARLAALRAAGVTVRVFTVDDPAEADALFAHGVRAVFSDRPDRLLGPHDPEPAAPVPRT